MSTSSRKALLTIPEWLHAAPPPYEKVATVRTARAAVIAADVVVAEAMAKKRALGRVLDAALAEENARLVRDGKSPEWPGVYWNGTGRYEEAWRHLEAELVPASGAADTHVGNVLRGFMKLYYRLNNDGEEPRAYHDESEAYFEDMGVTYTDLALDDAPIGRKTDNAAAHARWVEAFLAHLLATYEMPAAVLPLPGPLPLGAVVRSTKTPAPAKTITKRRRMSPW